MATINRYTIQGSIVVDQRPLTPPTPRYQVTITGGYLDDDPSKTSASYEEGSTVTITATPPAGKQFSHFVIEGGSSVSSSPATIIVTRNMTVTAMFEDAIDTGKLAGTWRANSVTTGGTEMHMPMQSKWIAKCGTIRYIILTLYAASLKHRLTAQEHMPLCL